MAGALAGIDLVGKRVLIVIPDGTRSGPIHLFFRLFHELLGHSAAKLDYVIALGTHQPMTRAAILRHLGVGAKEMADRYAGVRVFNHRWEDASALVTLGTLTESEVRGASGGRLSNAVTVRVNRIALDYDQLIVCGPVFPHEVVGFSGGNKYFFPGISGPEMINVTHWLGALITSGKIIGRKHTPVRTLIDRAAEYIDIPKLCFSHVVRGGELLGLFAGSPEVAWSHAADLSSRVHVVYVDHPYRRVLAIAPEMYNDVWTAAKGMYKLEQVVADGGEVTIYAPHIDEISYTHGKALDEIGYHVRDYFVNQWDKFKDCPWAVLAHSTHLKGTGTYVRGEERPRIQVSLATGVPRERCERVNIGYRDPNTIDLAEWAASQGEGRLVVPQAGETLYRLRQPGTGGQARG